MLNISNRALPALKKAENRGRHKKFARIRSSIIFTSAKASVKYLSWNGEFVHHTCRKSQIEDSWATYHWTQRHYKFWMLNRWRSLPGLKMSASQFWDSTEQARGRGEIEDASCQVILFDITAVFHISYWPCLWNSHHRCRIESAEQECRLTWSMLEMRRDALRHFLWTQRFLWRDWQVFHQEDRN